MIKRSTWIVLLLLVLVIGAYFFLKSRPLTSTAPTPTTLGNTYLLSVADDKLVSLRITSSDQRVTLVERDSGGNWKVSLPIAEDADQSKAEEAETQIGALQIVLKLETSPDLSAIGLDRPAYTIALKFQSGAQHTLEVGNQTPTGSGYYVRYDQGSIYVLSSDGIGSLIALVDLPPYAPTSTPIPTATVLSADTSIPAEATATP